MDQKKKGYGLMIVNDFRPGNLEGLTHEEREQAKEYYRKGALEQANKLRRELEAKGISFTQKVNKTDTEMLRAVDDLAAGRLCALDEYESVWLVISSHGLWYKYVKTSEDATPHSRLAEGDTLKADVVDGVDSAIMVESLTKTLSAHTHCNLKGKPIIIIIQACRGCDLPETVEIEEDMTDGCVMSTSKSDDCRDYKPSERATEDVPDKIPVFENQLLLWSTTPGNLSFRRPLFDNLITALHTEELSKVDVESLFQKVIGMVQENFTSHSRYPKLDQRKITPVYYSGMVKLFFLA